MAVIYYNKKLFKPGFEKNIHLLYVCKANYEQTKFPSALHSHEENFELLYICNGKGIFHINDQIYHVQAGDLVIYNQGTLHAELSDPKVGMEFFNCGLYGLQIDNLEPNHLIDDSTSPLLHCQSLSKRIQNIFEGMYEQLYEERPYAENFCQYALSSLIILLVYQASWEKNNLKNKKDLVIMRAKKYIDNNYLNDISIANIAQSLHISMSNLTHQFKNKTGFSPMQYIIYRRIGLAQSLLISSDKSITEISTATGYNNLSYFNNLFKRISGMSPNSYRKYRVGDDQYKKLNHLCNPQQKNL